MYAKLILKIISMLSSRSTLTWFKVRCKSITKKRTKKHSNPVLNTQTYSMSLRIIRSTWLCSSIPQAYSQDRF